MTIVFLSFFLYISFYFYRQLYSAYLIKPRANGRNIVGCYMLRPLPHHVACCWMLLRVVAQSLKLVKLFSQQLRTFLLFRDCRSPSNIVGATHAHYAWITKTYGLYPSHDALQVPTLLGVVASVCRPLPTHAQQLPTLLAQQCWELLRTTSVCSQPKNTHIYMPTPHPHPHPHKFLSVTLVLQIPMSILYVQRVLLIKFTHFDSCLVFFYSDILALMKKKIGFTVSLLFSTSCLFFVSFF